MTKRVHAGRYYQRDGPFGQLHDAPGGPPDVVICRRVADFPNGAAPDGARVLPCARCSSPIAFNPARRYTAPLVCMQCEHVRPDPL